MGSTSIAFASATSSPRPTRTPSTTWSTPWPYSLVCYILQIKDRHNANILINQNDGSLVHIDFGFILASRLLNFETAPFKITGDIIRLLGGLEGKGFKRFRERMVEGYMAL